MTTEKQQQANLANAKLSTGPCTEPGKSRAKLNALRHGLTGQFYVMSEADRLAYNDFEKNILATLAPVGHYERDLAVAIAQNRWRLNRARAIEFNIHGLGHQDLADDYQTGSPDTEVAVVQAQTWLNRHHALTNLPLYENRIERSLARTKKELDDLQTTRKAAEAAAIKEAELLLAQRVMNRESITPDTTVEVNGFVFSAKQLIAGINRKTELESARFYQSEGWDRSQKFRGSFRLPIISAETQPKAA